MSEIAPSIIKIKPYLQKVLFYLRPYLEAIEKKEQLMKTLDNVHTKFGKKKLGISTCYVPGRNWSMSRDKLSRNPFCGTNC